MEEILRELERLIEEIQSDSEKRDALITIMQSHFNETVSIMKWGMAGLGTAVAGLAGYIGVMITRVFNKENTDNQQRTEDRRVYQDSVKEMKDYFDRKIQDLVK